MPLAVETARLGSGAFFVVFGAAMAFFCRAVSRSDSYIADYTGMVLRRRKQENMELSRQRELATWARSLFRLGAVFFGCLSVLAMVAVIAALVE